MSGAAAYRVPPPAPVATHSRAPAAVAAAAAASSSRASGDGCRFVGVPPNAKFTPVEETSGTHMVLPERRGRALCSHFQKHGWCELGDHCAMAHPSGRSVRFNLLGYPIRPGQRVRALFTPPVPPSVFQPHVRVACDTQRLLYVLADFPATDTNGPRLGPLGLGAPALESCSPACSSVWHVRCGVCCVATA